MKVPHFQLITFLFCCAIFAACNHDDKAREAATEQALESINNQPPAQQQPATAPPTERPQAKSAGPMKLGIQGGSAAKGSEVCVAVTANSFKAILSMQYTLRWDPKVLKFKELKGFNLPQLTQDNFGRHILDKGLLTYSWYDANLKGVTKADGETLYQLCFEAIGEPGSKSPVQIVDSPTVFEVTNTNSEFFSLDATPGTVLVK